ncbi:MAG TPA: SUMF1/EgtB/PvdO family nonheme iron enzyme [Anaerolineales bacterium]|nr:SUMF1/EgtB/PvdO family nonheme iron enzyme [Anaerolineales bacterium]
MTEAKRPLKVFLCHAHADRDAVRTLYARLRREGVDVWLDKEKLLPGADWEYEIRKAVREADVVVVCLSKQFNQAGFRQKEVRLALDTAMEKPEGEIFIIPARLEECDVPESLSRWHWVDLFESDGFQRLMLALRVRADKICAALRQRRHATVLRSKPSVEQETAEKAQRDIAEKAQLDAEEWEEERQRVTREKADREAAEKARLDADELERQRVAKEKTDHEAAEKGVREKAEREAAEKVQRQASERKRQQAVASKPEPGQKQRERKKTSVQVIVAIVSAAATILVAILGSLPWGEWLTPAAETPTATSTSTPTQTPPPTRTPTPTPLPTQITDAKGVTMRLVPAGKFTMGSENGDSDERPVHPVYLDAFYMDIYEVTNALYRACVEAGVCDPPHKTSSDTRSSYYGNPEFDDYPVINVDWYQAQAYCEWRGARLPTEAEWEKAARGTDGRTFPWGEGIDCNKANYYDGNHYCVGDTTQVGSYENGKSPYGLYDMAGNVWEWVADLYSETYYSQSPFRNPQGPASGDYRVLRGGSWVDYENLIRSADRFRLGPDHWGDVIGFRCALSP